MKNVNRLKVVLVEHNRTGKWLAEQLGKDPSTISKWCSNTTQPPLDILINIAKLLNETEAFEILDYVKDLINEVDKNRDYITPNYEIRKLPSPIEIYTYLPKLNCKKCGYETCLAFATKFVKGEININKCIPLKEDINKNKLEKLKSYEEIGMNTIA